ncbi:exported protein of unknown function [uncultured Woeseiaceae bacterium]|uniref:Uncharacterized protein n=1 Tax=uncultured Woeseiaceae bacterium TaxID=1983305 RepID=A0A7D9D4N1_9GAMM|nr:exported protein of unknown function [uncultured Woeseiaceae bacterium]
MRFEKSLRILVAIIYVAAVSHSISAVVNYLDLDLDIITPP